MTNNDVRSDIVYMRTYARPTPEGLEGWQDTIKRVMDHQQWLWERALDRGLMGAELDELAKLEQLFLQKKALPAGRVLWLGGTDLVKRRSSTSFNCAFLKIEVVHDVVDAFWLLLQGCGVGFEPVPGTLSGFSTRMDVEILPSHRGPDYRGAERNLEKHEGDEWYIRVGDSGEAWAKLIGKLLAGKQSAKRLVIDLSEIRGAGGRMSQYGWISSGDTALRQGLAAICEILNRRVDHLLTWVDIIDIVNWLGFIQTGRRGAEIVLYPFHDNWQQFAALKKDYWKANVQRAQSNNSLVFYDKPTHAQIKEVLHAMVEAGGSEPGLINGQTALTRAPWFKGVNPCVTGDTPILTRSGHIPIKETVGKTVDIWDGKQFVQVTPFSTGINEVVTVTLSDGTSLNCTPYHKFVLADNTRVMADDLRPGDKLAKFSMPEIDGGFELEGAYSQGFYSGDGNTGLGFSWLYETKFMCRDRLDGAVDAQWRNRKRWKHGPMLSKTYVPFEANLKSRLNWLAGLLDADGTVLNYENGSSVQLGSVNKEFLLNIRLMLTTLGVQAKVSDSHFQGMRPMPDGHGGSKDYHCQAGYRLLINCVDVCRLIDLGLKCERLQFQTDPQRDARRFVKVISVVDYGIEETFCFNNPINGTGTFNGIVTAQCSEILLGNKSFCNLMEVDLAKFRDCPWELEEAMRLVGRANYRQTCVNLRDGILQSAWHENNEFLRLCGVGLTGIVRVMDILSPYDFRNLKRAAQAGACSMAKELGLPMPKAVTTIKPSGTVSKVMNTTEGIHKPLGRFIFNNIVFNKSDPLVAVLREANYDIMDSQTDPTAVIVKFPVKWDDVSFDLVGGKYVNQESAIDQLNRYKLLMENYVDHNCSITVSYSPDEIDQIADWIDSNWDYYVGVSFLFRADPLKTAADLGHPYLPQEVVSEKEWNSYVRGLKDVDLSTIYTYQTETLDTGECATGACPIR